MSVCVTIFQLTDVLFMLAMVSLDKSCVHIKRIMSVARGGSGGGGSSLS